MSTDHVAGLLKKLRGEAGFSQNELASKLRRNHTWVSKVERGLVRVDLEVMRAWAGACGRRVELTMKDSEGAEAVHQLPSSRDPLLTAIEELLPKLTQEERALLEAPVRFLQQRSPT